MGKDFNDLLAGMPPERRERIARRVEEIAGSPLYRLRKAMQFTQEQVAAELGIGQAAVSRLERRPDVYLSTLRRFVGAMGGELEIRARFADGDVVIDGLGTRVEGDAEAAHAEHPVG
ncbi:MAG: transcriptional regulator [Gemmatimonadetes bacterium]|nr:transcriptional regulator [Gemmatimonadota bacterium]